MKARALVCNPHNPQPLPLARPALLPPPRALAALLKELHKRNMGAAAAEVFDWLRGLPPGHACAHLLDVYTYTTMIVRGGERGWGGGVLRVPSTLYLRCRYVG
jgi:hypothetical protein